MKVFILNAGSSSQKSCLYDLPNDQLPSDPPPPLWEAKVDWSQHQGVAELKIKCQDQVVKETVPSDSKSEILTHLLDTLQQGENPILTDLNQIEAVGHRVVHGGQTYREATRITPAVQSEIDQLTALAPVHNPANLEGIQLMDRLLPNTPQVAVFDTAFHSHLPQAAAVYPGPYEWVEQGIQRYGFHGISHAYCAERAAQILNRPLAELNLITCHLGNGCSLAAIRSGRSVDTTMGFTPLEGIMMGTRSGSVDPGILIHLIREQGLSADQLDKLLNTSSGLKGISGLSEDMRTITAAIEEGNPRAQLALDIYIHRLRSGIGSMLASLEGLDAVIFTAGIGENSPLIRSAACEPFEWLGIKVDLKKNQHSPMDTDIATEDSAIRVIVVHTEEDWAIAQATWRVLQC